MTDLVHLHCHTEYSLLDGLTRPEEVAEIASSNGQFAAAVTDHGTMGSFVRFQEACEKQDIKPIFGVEAYFVDDVNSDDEDEKAERFHLIVLSKNDIGLRNLFRLNKVAWVDQFYYKPRIDFASLEAHSEGLICLSGCMGGAISQAILDGDEERAESLLQRFHKIFNDDFYVEIQPWNDKELNQKLMGFADAYNIPVVGTADCHYPTKDHAGVEETMLCSGMQASMSAPDKRYAKEHHDEALREHDLQKKMDILYPNRRLNFTHYPLYIMSHGELKERFVDAGIERDDIFSNTVEVADKCNAKMVFGEVKIPNYAEESNLPMTSAEYMRELCLYGLQEKGIDTPEYRERLEVELEVIFEKGFADYFLIFWDLVSWSDRQGIRRGTGRGSSCGCLAAYCLNITRVDPIKHDLLFFRFMNPERNDYPDIDMDFEDKRRDEVKQYMRDRWGSNRVAGIATYALFKAKGVVKSLASTFQVPFAIAGEVTKKFEEFDEYKANKDLKSFREKYPDIEKAAEVLLGRYKQTGVHAAGTVISSVPLEDIVPVETRKEEKSGNRIPVIAYDMDEVAKMGLIKNDPLSLKAMAVIGDAIDAIKERHGIDVWDISEDVINFDPDVIERVNSGDVVGVFQIEGAGYANLINDFEISDFFDLVVSNALVRPGSWGTQGKSYLARKQGKEAVIYPHEILEPILSNTYGKFIFEEQVMMMAVELAGFSWAKADRLRKIISKKKDPIEFQAYKNDFFEGASKYMEREDIAKLWDGVEKASTYMFNMSHAVAYSIMTYQTAWLKFYYPLEFMWATLYNESEQERVTTYLFEAQRMGINILGADVNESGEWFTITSDDTIRFGLTNVSMCGPSALKEILSKRPYNSYEEFINKVQKSKVKSNLLENLEKIGAFESLGHESEYEKEYYYGPILGWHILIGKESLFDSIIENCADVSVDSEGLHIIRGVVKDTKRKANYYRIEIEDDTGVLSAFMADKTLNLNKRDYVVALVGDSTIHYIEDFVLAESKPESDFAKFLHKMASGEELFTYEWLLEHGVTASSSEVCIGYIVSINEFTTKKDQRMAYMHVFFPGEGFIKIPIFSYQLESSRKILEPFTWRVMMLSEGRGQGWTFQRAIDVDGYCLKKGIVNKELLKSQAARLGL